MQANQALLEKLLEEKSRRHSDREPFINYVSETLRNVPDEQYASMQEIILDMMRARGHSLPHSRRDSQGPSWSRPGPVNAPPAGQPSQPYFHQQQQHYYQPQPIQDQSSSWHFSGYQPQGSQPQRQTPRNRDSAESVGRILQLGEDWDTQYPLALTGSTRQTEESDETD